MKTILWVVQIFLGLYFIGIGIMHFFVPPGLPAPMAWMYDLSPTLHWISGTAEILGGLGLILPSVTRIMPRLTVFAAYGLALVMIMAAGYHTLNVLSGDPEKASEWVNVILVLFNAVLLVWVARMRSGAYRIPARNDIAGSM